MRYLFSISILMLLGCESKTDTQSFIKKLEKENNISYEKIISTRGAYIPAMCYTKTKDALTGVISNPCYSCHTQGKIPNYVNDSQLQLAYSFPKSMLKNPYTNLFKENSNKASKISDHSIWQYVRQSNYFDSDGGIALAKDLPNTWKGYIPDCSYAFDKEGFDRNKEGNYTGWRAFRYYLFLGTFWPTNGSTDDVLIRLDTVFRQNNKYRFDKEIYKLNLSIVEALIKQKEIVYDVEIDETLYGVDIDADGSIGSTKRISPHIQSYVGLAKEYLVEKKIHLALGLFPENTEFLHSVRYIDWDDTQEQIVLSPRMKELRYTKKRTWKSYGQLKRAAESELWEAQARDSNKTNIRLFRGNYEEGLGNGLGWVYQGFIEDKEGRLRPQTHEETLSCMGCHSHLGATTDSSFSFARKFKGVIKDEKEYAWNHWTQKGMVGIKEPLISYVNKRKQHEYSFYLKQTHSGNAFRTNDEVKRKFFGENNTLKEGIVDVLHKDISVLLYPSKFRALKLNKAYKVMVKEQSYIYGKEVHLGTIKHVYKEVKEGKITGIKKMIIKE